MPDEPLGGDPPCWAHLFDESDDADELPPRIRVRRVYEPATPDDGLRVLVDRLWPRGLRRTDARVDVWLGTIAPSGELRRWYGHDPARWDEFARRYREELARPGRQAAVEALLDQAAAGPITLLAAARDAGHSNAEVLRQVLVERLSISAR